MNLLVRHPFVNVVEFRFCNLKFFLAVAFIYVYLEVVDFFLVFAYWDSIKPVRYSVCCMYMGCRDMFVADGSFDC